MSKLGNVCYYDFHTMTKQVYPVVYMNDHWIYFKRDRTGHEPLAYIPNDDKHSARWFHQNYNSLDTNEESTYVYCPKGETLLDDAFSSDLNTPDAILRKFSKLQSKQANIGRDILQKTEDYDALGKQMDAVSNKFHRLTGEYLTDLTSAIELQSGFRGPED